MDTDLGYRPGLECLWADVAESAVLPDRVVERLDVFEDLLSDGVSRRESFAVDSLNFHGMEEALDAGIIEAVTLAAHAAYEAMLAQHAPVGA